MKRIAVVAILALGLAACAITGGTFGSTPEAQIAAGARSVTAATTLATVLLKNNKITTVQAKGYSGILHTASDHLDAANATLVTCRKNTGEQAGSAKDGCAPGVVDDIRLAATVVGEVKKVLDARQ